MSNIRLVIATPTSGMVKAVYAFSLSNLIGHIAKGIKTLPNVTVTVEVDIYETSVIHAGRELLVNRAIARGNTHILFIDDDMMFEPETIDIMLGRRLDVVATNYPIKRFPVEFVAMNMAGKRIVTNKDSFGLEEIMYSGFGLSLFNVEAIKRTSVPRFQPMYVEERKEYTTEDVPLFYKLHEAGVRCYVDHDASKLVKHYGLFPYRWDLWRPKEDQLPTGPNT